MKKGRVIRMTSNGDAEWLQNVVQQRGGYDIEAVERFGDRLIRFANSRMPERLKRRIDPEDIVQSAFRSFFSRNADGKFSFRQAPDVWRLLTAITFRKVQRTIRFHGRQQRDIHRESLSDDGGLIAQDVSPTASSVAIMMELLEQILAELPESHQKIVQLRMEGYSVVEIAEKVNVSTRTVIRAMKLLRNVASEVGERP